MTHSTKTESYELQRGNVFFLGYLIQLHYTVLVLWVFCPHHIMYNVQYVLISQINHQPEVTNC